MTVPVGAKPPVTVAESVTDCPTAIVLVDGADCVLGDAGLTVKHSAAEESLETR